MTTLLNQLDAQNHQTIADEMTWQAAYIRGYREPNYKVPAIQRIIVIHPHEVIVWISYSQKVRPNQGYRCLGIEDAYNNNTFDSDGRLTN